MNCNELLKKLKKLAKERQVHLELIKAHGKGSHSTPEIRGQQDHHQGPEKRDRPRSFKKILDHLGINKEEK